MVYMATTLTHIHTQLQMEKNVEDKIQVENK